MRGRRAACGGAARDSPPVPVRDANLTGVLELRDLPAVDALVDQLGRDDLPRIIRVETARRAINLTRSRLLAGEPTEPPFEMATAELDRLARGRFQTAVNATGVLLHTNLGRAPMDPGAAAAAAQVATSYGNTEFDMTDGTRGSRGAYLSRLIADLVGAQAAHVVNNNAAALFLALSALARGKEVPVSRGELIEIGGSYRLPDLMAATGATMVEVGTTNRTWLRDYEAAIGDDTALLLKVHPSNYRVMGFTHDVEIGELAGVAHGHGVPLVYDLGSGLLDQNTPWLAGAPPAWLRDEPGVRQTLEEGADVATFSGDKLLGGPQAGIIVGRAELVTRLRKSPIARALRMDGPTMAALTVTFERYADGTAAELPFWRMATTSVSELSARLAVIADGAGVPADIRVSEAVPGAGSVPGMVIPSPVLAVTQVGADQAFFALLERGIVARRDAGTLLIDVRAAEPGADETISKALAVVCRS